MSIADKLTTVAENVPKVYEAGKQAEYDAFWDAFQNNGNRTSYAHAFRTGWRDSIYNPKYPIVCNGNNTAQNTYAYAGITDTKVPITIKGNNGSVFGGASSIKKILLLIVDSTTTTFSDWFIGMTRLTYIRWQGEVNGENVESEICRSVNLKDAPLDAPSLVSTVEALSVNATGKSATFKSSAVDNADWSTTEYASWDALIATKPNWSFSKV